MLRFPCAALCGLSVVAGCGKAIEPPLQDRRVMTASELAAVTGRVAMAKPESRPGEVVVARQDRCQVKVGQAVHFPFGYTVVPDMMISQLKVTVNGARIEEPEVFSPNTLPGYAELIYVFRPSRIGEYRVEVTPVNGIGDCMKQSCIVEVSE